MKDVRWGGWILVRWTTRVEGNYCKGGREERLTATLNILEASNITQQLWVIWRKAALLNLSKMYASLLHSILSISLIYGQKWERIKRRERILTYIHDADYWREAWVSRWSCGISQVWCGSLQVCSTTIYYISFFDFLRLNIEYSIYFCLEIYFFEKCIIASSYLYNPKSYIAFIKY